jgi:anaerobic ribonucleoside-triphosphate reductase activating protein
MNYATIKPRDIANGHGVRVSLFVSGCRRHCKNCFNPETWDFGYGKPFTQETIDELLKLIEPSYIRGLSVLGGEPFEPENQAAVLDLLRQVKSRFPEKQIWVYSGCKLDDELLAGKYGDVEAVRAMLAQIDILVDGAFVEELKDMGLRFRGSSNQRIIDVPTTLATSRITLWDGVMHI